MDRAHAFDCQGVWLPDASEPSADPRRDGVHRPAQRAIRGRVELPGAADRPVEVRGKGRKMGRRRLPTRARRGVELRELQSRRSLERIGQISVSNAINAIPSMGLMLKWSASLVRVVPEYQRIVKRDDIEPTLARADRRIERPLSRRSISDCGGTTPHSRARRAFRQAP